MTYGQVLIADDDPQIRNMLYCGFRQMTSWRIDLVTNGRDALQQLLYNRFDVALLDLKMPYMDGMTVLKDIQNLGIGIPVIVITGFGDVATAVKAMQLGARDFLEKPFGIQNCIDAILRITEQESISPGAIFKRLDAFIRNNVIRPDFRIADLCAQFNYSRSYLARLFQKEQNTTFRERVTYWRLQHAKHLLTSTNYPVFLIAKQCGFKNHRRLDAVFKRLEGISPTQYRKICRHKRTL